MLEAVLTGIVLVMWASLILAPFQIGRIAAKVANGYRREINDHNRKKG